MNRPLKNMTSVARKVHIPSLVDSFCCRKSSKCDSRIGPDPSTGPVSWPCPWPVMVGVVTTSDTRTLLELVLVRAVGDDRDLFEVVGRGGRRDGPLQAAGIPR